MSAPPIPARAVPATTRTTSIRSRSFPFFRRWPCGRSRATCSTRSSGTALSRSPSWRSACCSSRARRPGTTCISRSPAHGQRRSATRIHALFIVADALGLDRWARRRGPAVRRGLYYTASARSGCVVGFCDRRRCSSTGALRGWILQPRWIAVDGVSRASSSRSSSRSIFFWRERTARGRGRRSSASGCAHERVEREAALANLRALQAQIEPHFLFNTLANVTSLIDPDPATRQAHAGELHPLPARLARRHAHRVDHARRRGRAHRRLPRRARRCAWARGCATASTSTPDARRASRCRRCCCSPWSRTRSATGSSPRSRAARSRCARAATARTRAIEIADTGVGFAPATRGGVGLTNLRDRLRLLYGERASLTIGENAPAGTLRHA